MAIELTQAEFSRLCDEKAKQGYRFDRINYQTKELEFVEMYPGAAEDAKKRAR